MGEEKEENNITDNEKVKIIVQLRFHNILNYKLLSHLAYFDTQTHPN